MSRPRRTIGYARVSSEEQARGTSLQDQQNAIAAYAKTRGLTVTRFYVEAESAVHEKLERREQIQALMADVREGDLVLCDKLDRWSRDPEFTYGSVRKILAAGASFYAVSDRCDPSTSEGDTALGFRILFAREEHKRIRERMVGTRQLLRDQGYYVEGRLPFGYRRPEKGAHRTVAHNVLVVVPAEAVIVQRLFRVCIAGHALPAVAKLAGIPPTRAHHILHSRIYIGEIKSSRGEWIQGKHPPIIDAKTFEAARLALESRRVGGPRPRGTVTETTPWVLRDVATCALCGGRMGSAWYDSQTKRTRYYRCARHCNRHHLRVDLVDAAFEPLMLERLAELRESLGRTKAAPAPSVVNVEEKRARLARRRAKYFEAFADESMTRAELRAVMAKLDAERLKLDAEEQASKAPAAVSPEKRREMLREVTALAQCWADSEPVDRRAMVNIVAVQVRMSAAADLVVVWRPLEDLDMGRS